MTESRLPSGASSRTSGAKRSSPRTSATARIRSGRSGWPGGERAVRCAPSNSVDPRDAVGGGGPDRAVSPEISIERIDVIAAELRRGPVLQDGEAIAPDRQETVQRHAIARRGIDRLPVQR